MTKKQAEMRPTDVGENVYIYSFIIRDFTSNSELIYPQDGGECEYSG